MSFFKDIAGGNPFSTQIGHMIEQATDGAQASENWGLLMEICDVINEKDEGPKDALRATKKRLQTSVGKNYTIVMYTLTVLETCVKNCGKRFHVLVANKDFLQELVKIIGPKNDPPQVVQEKILSLIQTWADAFQGSPELKEVGKMYTELKSKGIEFPMTDLDHMAPIHTPARTGPEPAPAVQQSRPPPQRSATTRAYKYTVQEDEPDYDLQSQHAHRPPTHQPQPAAAPRGPVTLGADQMAKLKSELDVVQQNCRVFSEMLTEMTPGQENPSDLELLLELNRTCRQMQSRMVELLETVQNEDVTCELLRINDELNNVFLRFDRFERLRGSQTGQQPAATQPAHVSPTMGLPTYTQAASQPPPVQPASGSPEPPVANLIDLGDTPPPPSQQQASSDPFAKPTLPPINSDVSSRLADMNLGGPTVSQQLGSLNTTPAATGDEDFDMFAQSRQSFDQNKQAVGQGAYSNQQADQFSGGLGQAVNAKNTGNPYSGPPEEESPELIDNESDFAEMEKYLVEQGERPPAGQTATSSEFDKFLSDRAREADTTSGNRNGRQMQKDDQENALFSL